MIAVLTGLGVLTPSPEAAILRVGHGAGYDYQTITEGLAAAQAGDTVLVADGNYTAAKGERFPLRMRGGIKLQRLHSDQRPVVVGDENAPVIVAQNIADYNSIIDGLKFQWRFLASSGASGTLIQDANIIFKNCIIQGNYGYIALVQGGKPQFLNTHFASLDIYYPSINGVKITNSDVFFLNSTFQRLKGSGLTVGDSKAPIEHCIFKQNEAAWGGGIHSGKSNVRIRNCLFQENTGGGYYFAGRGYDGGGSALCAVDCNIVAVNCVFVNNLRRNQRGPDGSGVLNLRWNTNSTFSNCTFFSSLDDTLYGIQDSPSSFLNCIIWNTFSEQHFFPSSNTTVEYCDVTGGYPGMGNFDLPPVIRNINYDWSLAPTSPCIDRGTNQGVFPLDYYGKTRPNPSSGIVDVGAYEFYPGPSGAFPPGMNLAGYWNTDIHAGYSGNVRFVGLISWGKYAGLWYDQDTLGIIYLDEFGPLIPFALEWNNIEFPVETAGASFLLNGVGWPFLQVEGIEEVSTW